MFYSQRNQELFDKPILLTEEEEKAPLKVLENFFSDYRLSELRRIQEEIQEACLTNDEPPFGESEGRANFLWYNRKLICLFEAVMLLVTKVEKTGLLAPDHSPT